MACRLRTPIWMHLYYWMRRRKDPENGLSHRGPSPEPIEHELPHTLHPPNAWAGNTNSISFTRLPHEFYLTLSLAATLLFSCTKKDDIAICKTQPFNTGVWVCNEGSFGNSNASVTHISTGGSATQAVFQAANDLPLGEVAQSIFNHDGKGFIAVNGSQKVEVIDLVDGRRLHVLDGFDYPRHFAAASDGTVLVTNGSGEGEVRALTSAGDAIEWSVAVGKGPERMAAVNNYVAICNNGGWELDSTLSILDMNTQQIVETVHVGHRPIDITVDDDLNLWVLCSGETLFSDAWEIIGHTPAQLVHVLTDSWTVDESMPLGELGDHPTLLARQADGTLLVNLNGILAIDPASLENTALVEGDFYSLDVRPSDDTVWAAPFPDFQTDGSLEVYTALGTHIETHLAGVAPNGVVFLND